MCKPTVHKADGMYALFAHKLRIIITHKIIMHSYDFESNAKIIFQTYLNFCPSVDEQNVII